MEHEKTNQFVVNLFWGRMAELPLYQRVGALVFMAVSIASMVFCQLGFLPMNDINSTPVYLILILVPIVMSSIAFGPLTGALLGLFGGTCAFLHGFFFPLDFLETYYFGSPFTTILLFAVIAFIAGLLFDLALKHNPQGIKRVVYIIIACFVISFLASALLFLTMVLLAGGFGLFAQTQAYPRISSTGLTIQALVDGVLICIVSLIVDCLICRVKQRGNDRALFYVFGSFLVLVSAIVFMSASAIIFTAATVQLSKTGYEDMESELEFVQNQLNLQPEFDLQLFLTGYEKDIDGVICTMDNRGIITASNDTERFKIGSSLFADMGQDLSSDNEQAVVAALDYYSSGSEPIFTIQDINEDLSQNANLAYMGIRSYKDGYIALHRTSQMFFANRLNTMVSSTALALALVAAIALIAIIFVQRLIVRRIDKTNESLAKITVGNLDERIPPQSTREFTSLANGINSTVEALSNMIDEVAMRNEQDLATAKTIQESSLPTEFPAFPNIDSFDIYASMKTAKEVGGDFYDFFDIEGEKKIGFVIADVSGKGIPAALFMMAARSELRNFMEAGIPLNEAVNAANHQLCIGNEAGMFVTCWVAELNYETGLLSYVNAGHNPPIFMHEGSWDWVTKVSGMPLGLFDGIPYELHTLQLSPKDMIYTYTDGVTEAMSATEELFGEDRLEAVLYKNKDMNPRSVGVAVRRAITEYTHDTGQSDDITMLILKYGVPPKVEAVMALPAEEAQLIHVRNFINAELDRRKAPQDVYTDLDTLAEEFFMSACRHVYPHTTPDNPGEIRIGFEYHPNPSRLKITVADDGIPYNPLADTGNKISESANEQTGEDSSSGIGWQIVDDLTYERTDNSNIVSFSKSW